MSTKVHLGTIANKTNSVLEAAKLVVAWSYCKHNISLTLFKLCSNDKSNIERSSLKILMLFVRFFLAIEFFVNSAFS